MTHIRNIVESDFEAIVALNDAEVQQTSRMNLNRLRFLVQLSGYSKVVVIENQVVAFVIALREGALYENDNFRWFSARFPTFLYVDRIVVNAAFSGRGLGSQLYRDLFEFARSQCVATVTCEYNIEPPNPASQIFHDKFGFRELGTHWVADGTKRVSLQAMWLRDAVEEIRHRSGRMDGRECPKLRTVDHGRGEGSLSRWRGYLGVHRVTFA